MPGIFENISLRGFNTFAMDVNAKRFCAFQDMEELEAAMEGMLENEKYMVLGGGSNVLFRGDYDGMVLKNELKGIKVIGDDDTHVTVSVGAGENWHEFVTKAISNKWSGVENLSLIPGSVGAAPMQNIGAYGVELESVFESLEAFHFVDKEVHTFSKDDCAFGYRESVFKNIHKGKYCITKVNLRLPKTPVFNISYGAIEQELEGMGVDELSIKSIGRAVCAIRMRKLPDPRLVGNAGSFFKNPVVPNEVVEQIKSSYPEVVSYPVDDGHSKLAAGWLIDKAGWKGKNFGNYGVHRNQALVLVNYSGASGQDIYDLSTEILNDIEQKFGVKLEREVNII
jgi:UDP-N-acetylmuramate dehydrogenase